MAGRIGLKPLGHRIHVQPDRPPTETTSGLLIPNSAHIPPMSGTVIALGDGPERDAKLRARLLTRLLDLLHEADVETASKEDALALVRRELSAYVTGLEPEHLVALGDRVVFGPYSGSDVVLGEDVEHATLILREDDILAVLDPAAEVAA